MAVESGIHSDRATVYRAVVVLSGLYHLRSKALDTCANELIANVATGSTGGRFAMTENRLLWSQANRGETGRLVYFLAIGLV
jgi:hypothetical protein